MTKYEMSKIVDMINGMTVEEINVVRNTIDEIHRRKNNNRMIEYNVSLNIQAVFDFNGFENLVSDREFAEALSQFIADEVALGGGVAIIDINESVLNVN